jgi:hypothetical protein
MLMSWQPGNRAERKNPAIRYIFPGHIPSDIFPPARLHFSIMPSYYESIREITPLISSELSYLSNHFPNPTCERCCIWN